MGRMGNFGLAVGNSSGNFSIASSYALIGGVGIETDGEVWKKVWKVDVPERVRSFLWIMIHDRLLTNKRKNTMGLRDSSCEHCGNVVESSLHVMRDCPLAKEM